MLFNSIDFFIFLPVVVLVYFLLPHAWRWIWLLASSCFFFGYFYYSTYVAGKTHFYYYIIIALSVLSVILVDYVIAIIIDKNKSRGSKNSKLYLLIGILYPLLLLFMFKYFNFFSQTVSQIASFLRLNYPPHILNIIIPVGISYYTFHSISYIIDVYRGQKPERHLGIFSLYMLFFPKIVAGPIERSGMLIPQFREKHTFDYQRLTDGLKLMAWGFFKKIVIADRTAYIVNEVFNNPHGYSGFYLIIACLCFSFQVYSDFSGYSDIAVGTAELMGFRLINNFKRPFLATSISDLWRRWHISLISWFRDYIYIPLGGKRVAKWRWQYNIMVIFLLSGIWHGANWTFIIWSGLNGFYQLFSIWTENIRGRIVKLIGLNKIPRFHKAMQILITYLLFTIAVTFFRSNTASDGFYILTHLHIGFGDLFKTIAALDYEKLKSFLVIQNKVTFLGFAKPAFLPEMATLAVTLIAWYSVEIIQENSKQSLRSLINQKPWYVRWALYYAMLFALVFLGVFSNQQFLYFKF